MAVETTRHCLWCDASYKTVRQHSRLCGNRCAVAYHRFRQKYLQGLTQGKAFEALAEMIKNEQHPNPNHPTNKGSEEAKTMNE
ncbi:hypothetical protein D9M68_643490 [compost metagenome]